MSTTAPSLHVAPSARPPELPDPQVRQFAPGDINELRNGHQATEADFEFEPRAEAITRPEAGVLVFEVDSEGVHVVRDVLGAVYGAGGNFEEAREEFVTALDDHLRFLRANQDALDQHLRKQLTALERLFPGR